MLKWDASWEEPVLWQRRGCEGHLDPLKGSPLWIKQCGQARAAAMLAVVWEMLPAAKWGRYLCLCLISVAASLDTLTHPRMGWVGIWATLSSGWCPYPWQGLWRRWSLRSPPTQRFRDSLKRFHTRHVPRGSCASLGQGEGQRCAAAGRCQQHSQGKPSLGSTAEASPLPFVRDRLQLFLVTSCAPSCRGKPCAHQFLWQRQRCWRWQCRRGCLGIPAFAVLHLSYADDTKLQNWWSGQGLLEIIQSILPSQSRDNC